MVYSGADGDPIIILKNGQHEEDTDPWVPQVEDINTDKSSIYLTQFNSIYQYCSNLHYNSYFISSPNYITNDKFDGEQIIKFGKIII